MNRRTALTTSLYFNHRSFDHAVLPLTFPHATLIFLSFLLDMYYGVVLFGFLQLCEVGRGDVSLYTFNR